MNSNSTDSSPDIVAVLPAAGVGSRMRTDRPKQYLTIGSKTVIEHTIFSLLQHPKIQRIVVVISPEDKLFSALPVAQDPRISTVVGGEQRADSVLAGLQHVGNASWVLVHDASRPCLHLDDLNRLLDIINVSKVGGLLAVPVRDTIKCVSVGMAPVLHTVERENLWHALTPQLFPIKLLLFCLSHALNSGITVTDEASALEYCHYHPVLVSGRSDNIKVTYPEDLALAEFHITRLHSY